ncbi:MAG: WYL domain-containing protein [Deltaproteobacteria bacterium]|nr:WYL domain-containing protein [Deltaproteobacteria bacterium]
MAVRADDDAGPDNTLALNLARILLKLLSNPRGWRVDELQATLGIKDRTYRKYRALLQNHFDYLVDSQGSLVVEAREGDAKFLRLRDSEEPIEDHPHFMARAAALEMARQAFAFLAPTGIGEDIDAFQQEFLDRAHDRAYVFRQLLRDIDRKLLVVPDAPKDYSGQAPKVAAILHALMYCKRLRVTYEGGRVRSGPQLVEPLTLMVWRCALYLVVRFKGSKKPYYLAVDRMQEVERTGETFRYPPLAEYSPAGLLDGSFGIYREPGARPRAVELLFANERWLKMYLRERHWHPTQQFEDLPDGRLRMTFTATSMADVRTWIRGFGDAVQVVAV